MTKPAVGQKFVTFELEDDMPGFFTNGSTRYEYIADVEEGEIFYTVNVDDAEGNFVNEEIYFTKEEAAEVAKKMQENLDEDCGDYNFFVVGWYADSEGNVDNVG